MKTMVVIRSLMTVVVVAIGVTRIASGQVVLGGLLCALAGLNVAMIVTMTRRRAELQARFPGLANRDGAARRAARRTTKPGDPLPEA